MKTRSSFLCGCRAAQYALDPTSSAESCANEARQNRWRKVHGSGDETIRNSTLFCNVKIFACWAAQPIKDNGLGKCSTCFKTQLIASLRQASSIAIARTSTIFVMFRRRHCRNGCCALEAARDIHRLIPVQRDDELARRQPARKGLQRDSHQNVKHVGRQAASNLPDRLLIRLFSCSRMMTDLGTLIVTD